MPWAIVLTSNFTHRTYNAVKRKLRPNFSMYRVVQFKPSCFTSNRRSKVAVFKSRGSAKHLAAPHSPPPLSQPLSLPPHIYTSKEVKLYRRTQVAEAENCPEKSVVAVFKNRSVEKMRKVTWPSFPSSIDGATAAATPRSAAPMQRSTPQRLCRRHSLVQRFR